MRILILLSVLIALLTIAGCGFISDGPFGWVYTNHKTSVAIGPAQNIKKEGRACIHSFFGMISVGDATIDTARKSAGIKKIATVDRESFSLFGTYSRQCTVVAGE
jgi:hypothetical protein